MKTLSKLLAHRQAVLQQARLANLAFAFATLDRFASRVARAGIRGVVTLKPANPDEERYLATLTPHAGSQSVIEEHFTDEDLLELADVLGFASGDAETEVTFAVEDIDEAFVAPLRLELEREGIRIDATDATSDALA
jgi:hypothetical protein